LILDAPALPKSRCGQRCIGSRLAADLHWKVEPDALMPMARDACSGLGAAQLTRTTSRGLARSRTAPSATMARPREFVSWPVRERVNPGTWEILGFRTGFYPP